MTEFRLIISCEHAGNQAPAPYADLFAGYAGHLASHRGWDLGALPVAEKLASCLSAPLFYTTVSRLLIDNNRSPGHRGLFSEISRALSRSEQELIIERYYLPHRQEILAEVSSAVADGRMALHLAIHSFTPVLDGKERRADLGLLYDSACAKERQLCRAWQAELNRNCPGLTIRRNYPYRGRSDGLTTWLRRRFQASQYVGIEVEINQRRLVKGSDPAAIADLLALTLSSCLAAPLVEAKPPFPASKLPYEQGPLPPCGGGPGWGAATGDPGEEVVAIVDAENRVVGKAQRSEMRRQNLPHRATYILVFNQKGQIFVQKRTQSKDIYPGYFDVAAGGVVLSGETYEASAQRELREELGVTAKLEFLFDRYFEDGRNKVWGRVYRCRHEGPFVLQETEVESGAFMTPDEILAADKANFTPDGLACLVDCWKPSKR